MRIPGLVDAVTGCGWPGVESSLDHSSIYRRGIYSTLSSRLRMPGHLYFDRINEVKVYGYQLTRYFSSAHVYMWGIAQYNKNNILIKMMPAPMSIHEKNGTFFGA